MKLNTILLLLLCLLVVPKPSDGLAPVVGVFVADKFFTILNYILSLKLFTTSDDKVKANFETYRKLALETERNCEKRLKELKSRANVDLFQEKVGIGVHTLTSLIQQYMKNPKNTKSEEMLLSECLDGMPHKLLIQLNNFMTEKFFLRHAELNDYRFNEIEALRLRVMHAANQLGFAHVLCRKLVDNKELDVADPDIKFVTSVIRNITETMDNQLRIIDESYFPKHIKHAVDEVVWKLDLTGSQKEKNTKLAHSISHMLVHYYSYGVFTTSDKPILHNNAYTVYVSQNLVRGKLPTESVLTLNFTDSNDDSYHVLIYRSMVPESTHEDEHDRVVRKIKYRFISCLNPESGILWACSELEFCGISAYDGNSAAVGQNNFEHSLEMICGNQYTVMTGLPFGAVIKSAPESDYTEPDFLTFMEKHNANS